MILILANARDRRGVALRNAWGGADVGLVTPPDLSQEGWSFDPSAPSNGYAIVERQQVPLKNIDGICALLPAVVESDLPHIAAGDRSYVAAEMTAFLSAWLTSLPCPKVNPPSPYCLCGPNWRTERWIHSAAGLGLPTRPAARSAGCAQPVSNADEAIQTVVIVGEHAVGAVDRTFAGWAAMMANAAGVRLLNVHIGNDAMGPFVIGADVWADVSRPEVAEALLNELLG
jgi:hypothetical protein